MVKKHILTMSILLIIAFVSVPIGLSRETVLAHGHGHSGCRYDGCRECGHYACPGDCGKCEECLARQKAAKEAAEKCEKCGHVDCHGDCDKCVDCLNERIKKLEKELQKKKD
ncbi:MAG: hypothetical protein MRK01_01325 [Candidatus Scalindua sp.]|nr:hypothetical protein [Candidatus Scalindua sp.]